MLYTFTRTHIPTNTTHIGEFRHVHNEVFHNPDWYPQRQLDAVMRDLITKWNRQQPKEWRYALNTPIETMYDYGENKMTDTELSALTRAAMQEHDTDKAQAMLDRIHAELAKRGQLYETKGE